MLGDNDYALAPKSMSEIIFLVSENMADRIDFTSLVRIWSAMQHPRVETVSRVT